jgi:ABC-type antimicrobial peptide transport system permease subunit
LRTLGLRGPDLVRMLLSEQAIIYAFGVLGGTLLGAALAFATLPYLEFSDTTLDPASVGVPPYLLTINPVVAAGLYGALLLAFGMALLLVAVLAARLGLGRALHIGED